MSGPRYRATIGQTALGLVVWYVCATSHAAEFNPQAFVQQHCIRCHGTEKQKGDRRFDRLTADFKNEASLNQWQEILDVINGGEMPPEDEPQPDASGTKQLVDDLTHRLKVARESLAPQRPNVRRLNRHEYRNTIRDLLGVNVESFDPTTDFPSDERWEGFENIGDELVLSDYLLQQYLDAASKSVDKAARDNSHVKPIHKIFMPNDLCDRKFHFRPQIAFMVTTNGSYVDVGHGDIFSDRVEAEEFEGVPVDGWYTIRVKAEGINREHPYAARLMPVDRTEPIKMEVLVADPRIGGRLSGNVTDRSVAIVPLKDHRAHTYEFRVWMDKGFVPLLRYINGPQPIKRVLARIAPRYHAEVLPSNWRSGTDRRPAERMERYLSDVYQGPRMRIHRMELQGPERLPAQASRRAALLDEGGLERFLFRAFRRPPLESESGRYRKFMDARRNLGDSEEAALLATFKAILCSPNFLYAEPPPEKDIRVGFRIASRLSYFLWSSMPDEELFSAAAKGRLNDSKGVTAQARRMLKDPKAAAFTQRFTDSWLHLNELGSMPPDEVKFRRYYERRLQSLMKEETRRFFNHILRENLSIEHFIDADFTFLNRYLADHYGIPDVVGDAFQLVALPAESNRGGLLGHASVLTATSNGVETSPVNRGIWVLENILGTPPPPPPPDVDPLEPDIRGATTIREQLVKHRKVATCAACHRKIDPIGFALECFDPIGSFRPVYLNDKREPVGVVDTSGHLATGEPFANLSELKSLLRQRKDLFALCLTEKMLTYALGRKLSFRDRPQVEAIAKALANRGHGLRDLVELIVASDVFSNRNVKND